MAEIQAIFHLRHPSLVEFVGVCLEPNQVAIITELCLNGSLHSHLHTKPPTPNLKSFNVRRRLAVQLLEGVHYLHSLQPRVVHRDLKSLNVVVR